MFRKQGEKYKNDREVKVIALYFFGFCFLRLMLKVAKGFGFCHQNLTKTQRKLKRETVIQTD